MTLTRRCEECGSWGEECASETPQVDCACARCANARVRVVEAALRELYEAALAGVMETNMKHGGRFDEAMEKTHSLLGGDK